MKRFTILSILSVIIMSSFYIGTKFSGGNSSAVESTESVKYNMVGYYLEEDRDYLQEAKEIQSIYKTNMSTSKIKHLLIYIDGIAEEYDVNYNLGKAVITTESSWNVKARSRVKHLD